MDMELLNAISQILDEKLDKKLDEKLKPIYARLDSIESRLDNIEERLDILEEGQAELRTGVNVLLSWAEACSEAIKFPLPELNSV